MKKGDELTLDYDYDPNNCPGWFKEAFIQFAETADEETRQKMNPKYLNYLKNS